MSTERNREPQLIATSNPQARGNPVIWTGEEAAQGVFLAVPDDDPLAVLGMPTLQPAAAPRLPEGFVPGNELREWLLGLRQRVAAAAEGGHSAPLDLASLDTLSVQAVVEILGDGEVSGSVMLDGVRYRIHESVLTGIWRLQGDDGSHRVEVADLPSVIKVAADSLQSAPFAIPPGSGLMNAPAVLAEISERAAVWEENSDNHVLNFTLLPMSEADQIALREVLGRAELSLESGGFGRCRVQATRIRRVWAVQYLNALDHTILDTVEVGAPPAAVVAAGEDLEDTARRLDELLETYLQ